MGLDGKVASTPGRASRSFYDRAYSSGDYARWGAPASHGFYSTVTNFVETFQLRDKRCLEVGCGRGPFQDVVRDYTGLDVTVAVAGALHKPYTVGSATALPFAANEFDAVWTVDVLEHVADPETALAEIRRVLKPEGLLLLRPAWQCRPWAAQGYEVRPYSDLTAHGKLVKASIPIRDHVITRTSYVIPRRALNFLRAAFARRAGRDVPFWHRKLKPNYSVYWTSDSDAVNWMDPFDAIQWFTHRGDSCVSHPSLRSQFAVRTGPLTFRIHK